MCARVHACGAISGVLPPQVPSIFNFWGRNLWRRIGHQFRLGWLASKPGIHLSPFPSMWMLSMCHFESLILWVMGLDLGSSCLCGKQYVVSACSSTRLIIFKLTAEAEETIFWYILTGFYSQKLCRGPSANLQPCLSVGVILKDLALPPIQVLTLLYVTSDTCVFLSLDFEKLHWPICQNLYQSIVMRFYPWFLWIYELNYVV